MEFGRGTSRAVVEYQGKVKCFIEEIYIYRFYWLKGIFYGLLGHIMCMSMDTDTDRSEGIHDQKQDVVHIRVA